MPAYYIAAVTMTLQFSGLTYTAHPQANYDRKWWAKPLALAVLIARGGFGLIMGFFVLGELFSGRPLEAAAAGAAAVLLWPGSDIQLSRQADFRAAFGVALALALVCWEVLVLAPEKRAKFAKEQAARAAAEAIQQAQIAKEERTYRRVIASGVFAPQAQTGVAWAKFHEQWPEINQMRITAAKLVVDHKVCAKVSSAVAIGSESDPWVTVRCTDGAERSFDREMIANRSAGQEPSQGYPEWAFDYARGVAGPKPSLLNLEERLRWQTRFDRALDSTASSSGRPDAPSP